MPYKERKDQKIAMNFLCKKKNPLILPPSYGELPVPSSELEGKEDNLDVKKILKIDTDGDQKEKEECNKEKDKCLEESILEKIKNL